MEARREGAGDWREGGAEFQHEHHRKERKDKSIDFIHSVVLMSGAALKEEPDWTGLTGFTGLVDGFILSILSESLLYGASTKSEADVEHGLRG